MATFTRVVEERTDLGVEDIEVLARIVEEWSLLADLALSDLVLWVPTWNEGGLVAVAQVRPTTAPTVVPDDLVGSFSPRGRHPQLDQAAAFGRPVTLRDIQHPWVPSGVEAYPVRHREQVIGVLARHASGAPRVAGQLEEIYLTSADDLFTMVVDGRFPVPESRSETTETPRVGDGIVRLAADGTVGYASPNAVSALRRLGLATDVVGSSFAELAVRLSHRHGPMDETLSAVASGRTAGRADVENATAVVLLRGIPLVRDEVRTGAIIFLQDVTDLRRRERALIGKDATIREIHHRVKNNLQTVAAMLRLQARRASTVEAKEALAEAELPSGRHRRRARVAVGRDRGAGRVRRDRRSHRRPGARPGTGLRRVRRGAPHLPRGLVGIPAVRPRDAARHDGVRAAPQRGRARAGDVGSRPVGA